MRRLAVLALLLAASAREASANQCNAYFPPISYWELPLDCPLVTYLNALGTHDPPQVEVRRPDGEYGYITPPMTVESVELNVLFESIDENCVESSGYALRPYDRYAIDLSNDVAVGDHVYTDGGGVLIVAAGGACPGNEPPHLSCRDPIQDYWACEEDPDMPIDEDPHRGHDHGGCNAGAGVGFALSALLLGLRRRANSRR